MSEVEIIHKPTMSEVEIIHKPTMSEFRRMAIQHGYEKVVHAYWKSENDKDNCIDGSKRFVCSNCNYIFINLLDSIPKYCEECGSKMDKEKK